MGVEQEIEDGRAVADRFFNALLTGDMGELEASCAPGAVLWINLT
jgi:hypothetical protein